MRYRRRIRRRRPLRLPAIRLRIHPKILWSLLIGGFVMLIVTVFLGIVEEKVHPVMVQIAKTEVRKVALEAILEGIKEHKELGNDLNNLIRIDKRGDGSTSFFQIDSKIQAEIYTHTVSAIYKKLSKLKDRPIQVSIGQIFQSELFANKGPFIPLEIWPKGAPKVTLVPKSESRGINMVMITLHMHVQMEMGVLVPFSEEVVSIDSEYPIAQAVVVGEVPQYYFQNGTKDQNITLPIPTQPPK